MTTKHLPIFNDLQHRTSQYTGVTWCARHRQWRGRVRLNGKLEHVGYFPTEEAAHEAVETAQRDGVVIRRPRAPKAPKTPKVPKVPTPQSASERAMRDLFTPYTRKPRKRAVLPRPTTFYRLRTMEDYCQPGQWIVWRPGPHGEYELVNADRCTCETFATTGRCEHYVLIFEQEAEVAA